VNDRATFSRYVREVFAHLDDRLYLRSHPLTKLLAPRGQAGSPEELRRALVGAIEELRPPAPILRRSPGWRRYRYLRRRYVEGADPNQIAAELDISSRQARREHQQALETVSSVLWERYQETAREGAEAAPPAVDWEKEGVDAAAAADLEEELTRAAAEPPQEPTPTREVLSGVCRTVASLASSQRARMDLRVEGELSPVPVQRTVLRQILLGVLSCALDLARDGRVSISAANAGRSVDVVIVVRGAGAAGEKGSLRSLQAATVTEISVARRLAEMQGAALHVEAPDDDALSFHLSLPGAQSATVLVVDDNPDVSRLFRRYLAGTNYQLVQARTGAGALRQLQQARPDAIILDLLLPSEDGWEVLESLKGDPATRDIPVVVCSVLPDRLLALSLGVADFLSKPVTRPALLAALDRCLEGPRPPGSPERPSHSA